MRAACRLARSWATVLSATALVSCSAGEVVFADPGVDATWTTVDVPGDSDLDRFWVGRSLRGPTVPAIAAEEGGRATGAAVLSLTDGAAANLEPIPTGFVMAGHSVSVDDAVIVAVRVCSDPLVDNESSGPDCVGDVTDELWRHDTAGWARVAETESLLSFVGFGEGLLHMEGSPGERVLLDLEARTLRPDRAGHGARCALRHHMEVITEAGDAVTWTDSRGVVHVTALDPPLSPSPILSSETPEYACSSFGRFLMSVETSVDTGGIPAVRVYDLASSVARGRVVADLWDATFTATQHVWANFDRHGVHVGHDATTEPADIGAPVDALTEGRARMALADDDLYLVARDVVHHVDLSRMGSE